MYKFPLLSEILFLVIYTQRVNLDAATLIVQMALCYWTIESYHFAKYAAFQWKCASSPKFGTHLLHKLFKGLDYTNAYDNLNWATDCIAIEIIEPEQIGGIDRRPPNYTQGTDHAQKRLIFSSKSS